MTTTSFNSTKKRSPWQSKDRSLDAFVATSWPWPWQWTWPWQWNFQQFVIFQFAQNNADAGDDTAVFLPNNFLSSFVAECVVYSYDELIGDKQSCFEEEKWVRRYMFSNIFLIKAKPLLFCDIVLNFSITLLLIHVNYPPQEMFHPLRAPRKYQQYLGEDTLRLKQTR